MVGASHCSPQVNGLPKWRVKNPPTSAGDERVRVDPWVGKIPWRGHGNPPHCSRLENPMDRGGWWATVHGVTKSGTCARLPPWSFGDIQVLSLNVPLWTARCVFRLRSIWKSSKFVSLSVFYANIFPITHALSEVKEYVGLQWRSFWKPRESRGMF